jgi:hypothetical protein
MSLLNDLKSFFNGFDKRINTDTKQSLAFLFANYERNKTKTKLREIIANIPLGSIVNTDNVKIERLPSVEELIKDLKDPDQIIKLINVLFTIQSCNNNVE